MAKLPGDIDFTGTIDGLTIYKMYGSYFVRTKSSLTGKRFWKDKAFEGSRKSSGQLAKASTLTSGFYRTYPAEHKRKGLFNEMTGKVKLWMKEGKTEGEMLLLLQEHYPVKQKKIKKEKKQVKKKNPATAKKKQKLFIIPIEKQILLTDRKRKAKKQYGSGPPGVRTVNFVTAQSCYRSHVDSY